MYSLSAYGRMIEDRVRMEAYRDALASVVTPESVVLDIGTGTGVLALYACHLGARKVYGVEPNSLIEIGRTAAQENGWEERTEFIQDVSTRINLDEPADIIVADLRGTLPQAELHISSIIDARDRLMAEGGVLIQQRDHLWAAAVEAEELYHSITAPWSQNCLGLTMKRGKQMSLNQIHHGSDEKACRCLMQPVKWATIDYTTVSNPDCRGKMTVQVESKGVCHGLLLWFDAELINGFGFSNAPDKPELVYSRYFFPYPSPVAVEPGDTITCALRADLVKGEYNWSWNSQIRGCDKGASNKADFSQSTFYGKPLILSEIAKIAKGYRPTLSREGMADQMVLSEMTGEKTLEELAQRVFQRFPDQFADYQSAIAHVCSLSGKFSK